MFKKGGVILTPCIQVAKTRIKVPVDGGFTD
jgi:hypothetical protein